MSVRRSVRFADMRASVLSFWNGCFRRRCSQPTLDSGAPQVADTRGLDIATQPAMKSFLIRFFTWWNSQTFGTQLWTRLYGELVGEDEYGNRYYRTRGGAVDPAL